MNKNIVIIAGPTASGKTAFGIEAAKRLNGEIISADSMQIYKYMDIGTAKPSKDEMQGIVHHMMDVVYPDEEFSVALFRRKAGELIDDIISRGKLPIIVGGTGLYINSITYPLDFTEVAYDNEYRDYLNDLAKVRGNHYIHEMLSKVDYESYLRLHPNDTKRIIRALEVYKNTGKTISQYQTESRLGEIEYNIAYVGLNMDRAKLYDNINRRVDKMFEMNLIDEVKKLQEMGYNKNMNSIQGIGYKEIFEYLEGNYTLEEIKDIIKQSTRRYAKRQLTWFRREKQIYWVNIDNFDCFTKALENIVSYIEGKFELV